MDKFNPFRPNHIVPPGIFSGRNEEVKIIRQALIQTKHGNPQHFLLQGERGIGKSSLLLLLNWLAKGELSQEFNFLTLHLELESNTTYVDLIKKLASALKTEISRREKLKTLAKSSWDFLSSWEILGVKYHKSTEEVDPHQLLPDLAGLFVEVIKKADGEIDGIVILIDEADKPGEAAQLGAFCKLFTERLTVAATEKVLLGLAGLPLLISKLKDTHESAPRVFQTLTLETLTDEESVEVIDLGLKEAHEKNGFETKITEEARKLIANLSEGYPHFLQQFAYSAFDYDSDNTIDELDVINSSFGEHGALTQLGKKFFSELYFEQINSDEYRRVLNTMADSSDGWVSRADITKASGISTHTIANALRALKAKNIIQVHEGKKGFYRLPTKSFAAWIKAYQSLKS